MEPLREYIFSVITAAVICALIKTLFATGSLQKALSLLCGLFLSITILSPLAQLHRDSWFREFTDYALSDGNEASFTGENFRREAMSSIIKERTEAYIFDKAAQWNESAQICVSLQDGDIPVPVAVEIRGAFSPYARQQLASLLEKELGIAKENQQWIG